MTPWQRYVAELNAIRQIEETLERRKQEAKDILRNEQATCPHAHMVGGMFFSYCTDCGKDDE